jgi:hypothetical protein
MEEQIYQMVKRLSMLISKELKTFRVEACYKRYPDSG